MKILCHPIKELIIFYIQNLKKIVLNFQIQPIPVFLKMISKKIFIKKINELKKHFSGISKSQNFDELLILLSTAKRKFMLFDNVKVNDDSEAVKKNRLELINFFCKTYENFIDFQLIKDINE